MVFSFLFRAPFVPKEDIPSLENKTIIITGANTGIGKEHLRFLANYGGNKSKLYLGARNRSKAEEAIKDLETSIPGAKIHFLELDLSSLASVKAAADKIKSENSRLDILVNNAGIMALPASLTKEGYEIQFGTNHVGHYLFTRELLPLLTKTAETEDVRIINLSSMGHSFARSGIPFEDLKSDMKSYSTWTRYGHSKLSNILFTRGLTKRYPQITSVSIHPGGVNTNLSSGFQAANGILGRLAGVVLSPFLTTPADGALNSTWATVADVEGKTGVLRSTSTKKVVPGAYYSPVAKIGGESKWAKDEALAERLWEWTEKEVKSLGY